MGNCLNHRSLPKYAEDDDEWDWPEKHATFPAKDVTNSSITTEIKIKMTKKQLEEILGKVELKDVRVEQVLAELMSHSNRFQAHQRAWRPALQSIPEVN